MWGCGLVTHSIAHSFRRGESLFQILDRCLHGSKSDDPSGGPEVVPASLEPKRPVEPAKLAYRLADLRPARRLPTAERCAVNVLGRPSQSRIALVRLRPKPLQDAPILIARQALRVPGERGAAPLLDLLGEPLEGLP